MNAHSCLISNAPQSFVMGPTRHLLPPSGVHTALVHPALWRCPSGREEQLILAVLSSQHIEVWAHCSSLWNGQLHRVRCAKAMGPPIRSREYLVHPVTFYYFLALDSSLVDDKKQLVAWALLAMKSCGQSSFLLLLQLQGKRVTLGYMFRLHGAPPFYKRSGLSLIKQFWHFYYHIRLRTGMRLYWMVWKDDKKRKQKSKLSRVDYLKSWVKFTILLRHPGFWKITVSLNVCS